MSNLARVGDPVSCPDDLHGSPPWVMSFPVVGIFTQGSPNVMCNNLPAIRLGDPGEHVLCPGPNNFVASSGANQTLINNKPAVREKDQTLHCGASTGHVMDGMGSPNTQVGK